MVKGEIMHVTKVKPCVSNAINALAQLYKTGFIKEVRFKSYVLMERNHKGISYTEVIFQSSTMESIFPDSLEKNFHLARIEGAKTGDGVSVITKDSFAIYAYTYTAYGPTGQTGGLMMPGYVSRNWFTHKDHPTEHWAYQENAPDMLPDKENQHE
jgi:hypothetical protein